MIIRILLILLMLSYQQIYNFMHIFGSSQCYKAVINLIKIMISVKNVPTKVEPMTVAVLVDLVFVAHVSFTPSFFFKILKSYFPDVSQIHTCIIRNLFLSNLLDLHM